MIRQLKDVDWMGALRVEDYAFVQQRIEPEAWYPMASFERLGLAILSQAQAPGMDGVRLWGLFSANSFVKTHPTLVAKGDPVETLMRLKVMRSTMFDFTAFDIPTLTEGHALVTIAYQMSAPAEEAACHQTIGFCEGVLGLAGAKKVRAEFTERAWSGAARTSASFDWQR
jgi:hypothetical protein